MTTATVHASSVMLLIRRGVRRTPEYGALLAAAVAWVALVVLHSPSAGGSHGGHHADTVPTAAPTPAIWALMCVAMMLPASWPAIHHVGMNSLRWRRQRAIACFLAAYLGVWVALGVVGLPALHSLRDVVRTDDLLIAALVAAAVWQLLPYQRYFMRACHRTVPLPPRGWRATAACVRFGLHQGRACVGICGPLMLVMAVTIHANMLWMVLLAAMSASLKLMPARKRIRKPLGCVLAILALVLFLIPLQYSGNLQSPDSTEPGAPHHHRKARAAVPQLRDATRSADNGGASGLT